MADYQTVHPVLINAVHDQLELSAQSFNSSQNFDWIFGTVQDFPESAGIVPLDVQEKVMYMATFLLYHLATKHCYNDGNKRTAFLAFSLMLISNRLVPTYNEGEVAKQLDQINHLVSEGESSLTAISEIFHSRNDSHECLFIRLLFDLSAASGENKYESPIDIFPVVRPFIIPFSAEVADAHKYPVLTVMKALYKTIGKAIEFEEGLKRT